eukprot:scaffold32461_cov37-Attheya_sp.AAC.1
MTKCLCCSSPHYYSLVAIAFIPIVADAVACSKTSIRSLLMTKCLHCLLPHYYQLVAAAVVPIVAAVACSGSSIRLLIMTKCLSCSLILTSIILVADTTVAAIAMDKQFTFVSKLHTTSDDIRAVGMKHPNGSVVTHDMVTASLSRDDVR